MSDPLDLKKHIREVKDFPIEGINFRDPKKWKNKETVILKNPYL